MYCYIPFDLHVLGTPPAFILSQDRTLINILFNFLFNLMVQNYCLTIYSYLLQNDVYHVIIL